ncbi:glycerol-3-phosphate dehydrogenase [Amycolatopsis sp. WAC 01375]|uniref:glycerol-3-phosphate dehydrogenase/oxidase n=1 Tax=unclassified Amycolatopsis TaxID=2618356 RepID=UPI000F7B8798|nr:MULTISPECIES: glycerol-3-phosphate dehydrogenase/oxidase [unclassified Amycolatopsis]RSM69354.1 glycerol-3-phosphate dehydrogenase [Amycolatopsis sp. WAC 01375]RSN30587.1 glycerol-3-phosphate dehydrogenase [Amycolatopsis sp. WAC 01416]
MTALNRTRRTRDLDALAADPAVDLLVIGGGVTGTGAALDAAARGLRVVLVESRDWAFGTSRWSSKLVHGGLRYLASGRVGVANESAVERGVLMTTTAPHLVRPLPTVVPLLPSTGRRQAAVIRAGFVAGDALRVAARTPGSVLPLSGRVGAAEVRRLVPGVSADGLRGGFVAYDGQLIDDARLVVALARTAAEQGATVLTRMRAEAVTGTSARLVDTLSGESMTISARAVISAAGVWAGDVDPSVRLRPSRGTHLVLGSASLGDPIASLTVPVPGSFSRFVFAMPEQLGRVYVGLTDEDAPGPIPDVPVAAEAEITFLLDTVNQALGRSLTRGDVLGTYSGLRPLIDTGGGATSDVSRRHAVMVGPDGVISVIGGKLTTYRRMAEDVVDKAVLVAGLTARPCGTRGIPLVGAPARPDSLPADGLPASLVARHGGSARAVVDAATVRAPLEPIADGIDVTRAEIEYAITHEGALDLSDVLDRRTRIGLVQADADSARAAVDGIFASASLP